MKLLGLILQKRGGRNPYPDGGIDLMGHTGHKPSQGGHFFGLNKLIPGPLQNFKGDFEIGIGPLQILLILSIFLDEKCPLKTLFHSMEEHIHVLNRFDDIVPGTQPQCLHSIPYITYSGDNNDGSFR